MSKLVTFKKEGLSKMLEGLNKAADAVSGTLGPKGGNVFVDSDLQPRITNDGATIAQNIIFEDKLENAGAYLIKNVSSQTNDDAGDGTTTTAVLTQAIVHESLKRPENPILIKESLKKAGDKALKILSKRSIKIDKEDIEKVALVSSENKELAKIITEIINKVGEKAIIKVDDSATFGTEYEIIDGYKADAGFVSPHFITDKKTMEAIFQDVHVLVSQQKISNLAELMPLFEEFKIHNIGKCVVVCEDIDDSMIGLFVTNKNLGTFQALVLKTLGDTTRDIAGATGATLISDSTGVNLKDVRLEHLGLAKKVIADAKRTLFIPSDPKKAREYATGVERDADREQNQYVEKAMRERVAKLRGSIAILKVGAATDFEREYLKYKAEDAVKAVQAALSEGVVEGGGIALWRIAKELKGNSIGEEILKNALTSPLRKIIENAGKDYTEIVSQMPDGQGYDAKNDKYVPMVESGIIDPTKVERCALENSVSAASVFITTFCIITFKPQDDGKQK